MEVYAGFSENTDYNVGRVIDAIEELGELDNTLVIRIWGDNGASLDRGGLRSHFTHVIDLGPTILEIAGIPMPSHVDGVEQEPMHGVSFTDSLSDAGAPERHTQQYFETIGNRAMYKDGWWLAVRTQRIPWVLTPEALKDFTPGVWHPDADPAELYYLPDDFTQARDLAGEHPEKVQELKELFWEEAEKYKVLPLMAALAGFFGMLPPLPEVTQFEFRGDVQNVMSGMIPRIYNHSYTISADLVVPAGGANGVIVAEADHLGGFSLFVQDGKLTHTYSMMGVFVYRQQAEEPLPEGDVNVGMAFAADAAKPATGGEVSLFINDKPVAKGRMDHTVPVRFSAYAGMDIGRDNGGVVDRSYEHENPFAFTGTIKKVAFDIKPQLTAEEETQLHAAAHHGHTAHALSG
jgi:arylsulfatase